MHALTSNLSTYLTSATAISTYATLTSISNLLNGTTSHTGFTNSGASNLNGITNILELSETIASITVRIVVELFFFITGQSTNFTLALTNLNPSANRSYSVT
jgi:hypothetical protein